MGGLGKMVPSVEAVKEQEVVSTKLPQSGNMPAQGSKKKKGKATDANVDQKEKVVEVAPVEIVVAKQAPELPVAPAAAAPVVRPAPVAVPEGPGMKMFHWIVMHFGLLMWSTSAVFAFLVLGMCGVMVWLPYEAYSFISWYTTPTPPFAPMRPVPKGVVKKDGSFASLWKTGTMLEKYVDQLYEAPLQTQIIYTLLSTVVNYMILCWYVRDNQPTSVQILVPEAVQLLFDHYMPF